MGMRPSVFWLGWAVTAVITSLYVSILVIVAGTALSSFIFITHHPQAPTLSSPFPPCPSPSSPLACTPSASSHSSSSCIPSRTALILEGAATHVNSATSVSQRVLQRRCSCLPCSWLVAAPPAPPPALPCPPHSSARHRLVQHRARLLR